jgi:hypothetical protein
MSQRMVVLAVGLIVGWMGFAAYHLLTPSLVWIGTSECIVTGLLTAAIAVSVWSTRGNKAGVSVAVACAILAANTIFLATTMLGRNPFAVAPYGDGVYAAILFIAGITAIGACLTRRLWGRWLALGFGTAGAVGFSLNFAGFWSVSGHTYPPDTAWYVTMAKSGWLFAISVAGSALIVMNMMSSSAYFVAHGVWRSPTVVTRSLVVSMITGIGAAAMLLAFGFADDPGQATRMPALVLAGLLILSLVLVILGRTAGALLLIVCGAGLVAQTIATLSSSGDYYFPVFWSIGAASAFATGARLFRPALTMLWR